VVREVLKHDSVEKVYFIENRRRGHLMCRVSFPRRGHPESMTIVSRLKCMDGAGIRKGRAGDIDAVIVDSTDIIGFAKSLFTVEFFKSVKDCLPKTYVRLPFGVSPFSQGDGHRSSGSPETHLPDSRSL